MTPTPFDLARRIEGINAAALVRHGEAANRLFPTVNAASLAVAGGVASFVGAESPISYAVGLGFAGPVTADDIARVVEFYQARGMVPRVDVCPYADRSLLAELRQAGFALHGFVNVLARTLAPTDDIAPPCAQVVVREAAPDEDERWMRVVDEGFAEGEPLTEPRRQLGLMMFHLPNAHAYFAEVEGEIAGAGALFMHEGYAALAAASTRVAFRNRGVQTALIRVRLKKAQSLGCDLAGFFALPGNSSERNAQRHGFRLAYTKASLKKG
jgi:hypothetical protein